MNAVRQLFAKKPAASAAVKRTRKSVKCGELNAAIEAATAEMDHNHCSTRQTLEALWDLTDSKADGDTVVLDGPAPISCAQLDEALAEAQHGLPAGTLAPLKRVRTLLEQAEAAQTKEPAQYVTVAQLKAHDAALFDAFSWAVGAMAEELNRGQPSQAHVIDLLQRSANTPERKTLFSGICKFKEAEVPKRTQQDFLRYQSRGHY